MEKRLFIAINLPIEIKGQIADLVKKLEKANKNKPIKWVEDENFHLTLHFLGSTPLEKLDSIDKALEPIVAAFPTLNFQLSDTIDAFPNLDEPKVIFLKLKELNNGQVLALQKKIGQALEVLEFEIDPRPFRLHLTLGRVKSKSNLQIPKIEILDSKFQVSSIDLMESNLTSSGPVYTFLKKYSLKE